MPQYKTKSLYENCHPVIAEHLKRGEAIWCKVWDRDRRQSQMSGFVKKYDCDSTSMAYLVNGSWWQHAEPIPQKQKVRRYKKASEIIRWCEEQGYEYDGSCFVHCNGPSPDNPTFIASMMSLCGGEVLSHGYMWHPDWIEETEE